MIRVGIVNYNMGNIGSIERKLNLLNCPYLIASNKEEIGKADKIILPGVGHFSKAMDSLKSKKLIDPLNEAVLINKKPILGICLGMQLMTTYSEEGNAKGLNWINAEVKKFQPQNPYETKVPHIGWNTINIVGQSPLMRTIEQNSKLYFVHSFYVTCKERKEISSETFYEHKFVSSFNKENIFGVQFHPEKSHDIGIKMIKNFIEI